MRRNQRRWRQSKKSRCKGFHCWYPSPPKWRMIGERVTWNSLRPITCWLKEFMPLFPTRICSFQKSWPDEWPNGLLSDEEGASQDMRGVCSDKLRHFLTVLYNVLNVCEQAGGEERAGWLHPHPGVLIEGAAGGGAKNGMAADFASRSSDRRTPPKINLPLPTYMFVEVFRESCKHTLYTSTAVPVGWVYNPVTFQTRIGRTQ